MKNFTLSALLSIYAVSAMGQACTPDQSFANSGPGIYPLTMATVDCSDTLSAKTIVSITDTAMTTPAAVTIYYDSTRVASVTGLPANLSFGTDVDNITNAFAPYGAWVNGGSIPNLTPAVGCVYVHGEPAAWAAAAAGGVGGTYTLSVQYDARISQTVPDLTGLGIPPGTWLSDVPVNMGGGFILIDFPIDANPTNTLDATVSGLTSVDGSYPYGYTTTSGLSSYVWTVTGGTIQNGQGTYQITVIWDGGSSTGNVEVTVGDGTCEETDDLAITSIIIGIRDIVKLNARVFPNPNSGQFSLQLGNAEPVSVEIFDVTGKRILSEDLNGSTDYPINLDAAPAGVYVLRLENRDGVGFKRLIKQ